ncbi:MAG: glycosyltransferase family 4 protein [Candidatus Brocadiae bacterium]|nr:glycosyltransferase family 4 protein [Candidatus Brocadiia bacterium]
MDIVLLGRKLDVRGSTLYAVNLGIQLLARGHSVRMLCGGGQLLPEFERAGIPVVVFPGLGDSSDLFLTRKLARKVREKPASLLHVIAPSAAANGASLARAVGLPYLVSVQAPVDGALPTNARYLRGVIVSSETVRESLVNHTRLKKDLIRVILPGADVKRLKESPPFPGEGAPVIAILGPMEPGRGHDTFLDAAKLVLAQRADAQFLVVGEGPEEDALRKKTKDLGIQKNVIFSPDPENTYGVLAGIDILLMPFQQDGLGNAVIEAMACGKPVIASGLGGVYYVIREEETGLLRPKNDAAAFADAVLALIRDREKARRIGHAARLHVEQNFNAERMAAETLDAYREALEAPAANA